MRRPAWLRWPPGDDIGRRPPLWHPDFPFVLLWSHKAASTVLAHWFFEQIGAPQRAPDANGVVNAHAGLRIHAYQLKVYSRAPGYLQGCRRALRERPVIKFVRDPAARAYSGFLDTRRRASVSRPDFWGAKVRREVLAWLDGGDGVADRPYSFADFVDWLAVRDDERLNNHVRPQAMRFERGLAIERVPIETLAEALPAIERRFGLSACAQLPGMLSSPHHRPKTAGPTGAALAALLAEPVPLETHEKAPAPRVDTAALAGTGLGARIRHALSRDYADCPVYSG